MSKSKGVKDGEDEEEEPQEEEPQEEEPQEEEPQDEEPQEEEPQEEEPKEEETKEEEPKEEETKEEEPKEEAKETVVPKANKRAKATKDGHAKQNGAGGSKKRPIEEEKVEGKGGKGTSTKGNQGAGESVIPAKKGLRERLQHSQGGRSLQLLSVSWSGMP